MLDEISIGATPNEESCAQVGTDGYEEKAMRECKAYIAELKAKYGEPPFGAKLRIKSNPHDFGSYYDVVCEFNPDIDDAYDYSMDVEMGTNWWTQVGRVILDDKSSSGYDYEDIRDELYSRIDNGDYDISDIFDGDLVDFL